ncbi:MAG: hypothetical protein MJK15_00855 [Colwellia sp.]|nr:hypothetical protein [Colwellia sp.]
MKFDPTKKYGTVYGACSEYPGAKYSQNGFLYNSAHKCINPKEAEEKKVKDVITTATDKLLDKKKLELKELTAEVGKAQEALSSDGSSANKGKLTKLTNKYNELVAEIDKLEG